VKKITSIIELRESIFLLEIKKKNDAVLLKEQFEITFESLKPINIIKNTIKEVISGRVLKRTIVDAAIGLTTGFVTKKVFTQDSHNPLTKLLGFILEMAVANKIAKNADEIKSVGSIILKTIIDKHADPEKK
jgi:hypothetical protein